jgi:hypothetical protein
MCRSYGVFNCRCSDVITPTINGMRIFGISKGGITRAIVKFSEPPPSWPLTVCFHFPSTFLTHRYVLDMVRSKICKIPNARVTTIQFIDRNTMHGTQVREIFCFSRLFCVIPCYQVGKDRDLLSVAYMRKVGEVSRIQSRRGSLSAFYKLLGD